ncbi:hypothetical protein OHA72_52330 [Dactylosporangium sp. NBC_01737]|uniref:hypothetical protein n=1 Tax=Dactylosporangium sp. NBC_01737 TaxID=2975959 RepID=UPI002E10E0F2|nr:hypothetical protein OHA72_52330 [Dactylosporangium sp. NBC_01737]
MTPAEAARAEARLTGTDRETDLAFLAGDDTVGGLVVTATQGAVTELGAMSQDLRRLVGQFRL